ncbi:hypothetical protein RV11_GL002689 [Enterococcus phoeniculicola]|uniref:PucR family transcriptional regulator n=1 Tax=Enterococcus phoeniculicola ATCC BAA-412 TaxID=1158610 RepID=R3TKP4_9ENTE|nr:PucR family transcriptional regulator [Enterococcus phoeniculicola]EOL41974.1 hypothetical protein UC3_02322 [Enterococcus phoeniculicola ATCC BAA-412]EOT79747.1 hypothetical protein I589_01259 [Enterococcus phoeniculicola ATCC BAA-412]OJG69395.1 hypothetical protein RV11_GL002689 [Enterococcus phoeniculicola]
MITLKQLMNRVELPIKLINGPINFNSAIDSVTIMESPKVKFWLQGGEFLLTSSETVTNDFQVHNQLIEDLIKLHAIGLAIKIQEENFCFSETALKMAREANLPIFTIPVDVTYLTIMDRINHSLFVERESVFLRENLAKYLLTTRLQSAPLQHLKQLSGVTEDTKVTVLQAGPNIDWFHTSKTTAKNSNYWQIMQNLLLLLIQQLNQMVETNQLTDYLYVNDINSISVILFSENKIDDEYLYSALKKVNDQSLLIKNVEKDSLILYFGLSDPVPIHNIVEGNRQATFTHKMNQFIGSETPILLYATVEFYDVMNRLADTEIANHLMNHLEPIIDNRQLMETLQTFFRNNEQLKQTSEELFIHINTLRYRLEKIEKLTGLNYGNTSDKLKMFLGIVHFELNKMTK